MNTTTRRPRSEWRTYFCWNVITRKWEAITQVKSIGLAALIEPVLIKTYPAGHLRLLLEKTYTPRNYWPAPEDPK